MSKLRFNNTYESGKITIFVYSKDDKFFGVCLEFDLVVEGLSAKEAEDKIISYSQAWLKNVKKNRLPEKLLNKPAPREYWEVYKKMLDEEQNRLKADEKMVSTSVTFTSTATHRIPYDQVFAFA